MLKSGILKSHTYIRDHTRWVFGARTADWEGVRGLHFVRNEEVEVEMEAERPEQGAGKEGGVEGA